MNVTVAELHHANLKYLRVPVSVEIETAVRVETETDFSVEIEAEVSDILIKKIPAKKDINVKTSST